MKSSRQKAVCMQIQEDRTRQAGHKKRKAFPVCDHEHRVSTHGLEGGTVNWSFITSHEFSIMYPGFQSLKSDHDFDPR